MMDTPHLPVLYPWHKYHNKLCLVLLVIRQTPLLNRRKVSKLLN